MAEKKLIVHRRANDSESYATTSPNHCAEGDLVNVRGKLYMFHPGGIFTFFIVVPLFYLFWLTWKIWEKRALPYDQLLRASSQHKVPIVLELKNISADQVTALPTSIAHIDAYDLNLGLAIKKKFKCRLSLHTLWANENSCLVFKSSKGLFRWHRWSELTNVDILTITFQLTPGWFRGAEFWQTVKQRSGKTIVLGGGFMGKFSRLIYGRDFETIARTVDGWYLR